MYLDVQVFRRNVADVVQGRSSVTVVTQGDGVRMDGHYDDDDVLLCNVRTTTHLHSDASRCGDLGDCLLLDLHVRA